MKPEFIFIKVAKFFIKLENFLEKFLPAYFKKFTWNFSIDAKL